VGDTAAFEILLEPLLEPGYRLAGRMLHDHQAAQDAVQEAAVKAWRKLRQLREGSEMRPWFLGKFMKRPPGPPLALCRWPRAGP
jgi:DNA-directed RNA polymerase specialized sigma24 family protein